MNILSPHGGRNRFLLISEPRYIGDISNKMYNIKRIGTNINPTTIKVFAKCLRPDIEYKTLSVTFQTSSREVVAMLLGKYRMKHRDPRLFYLTMEVAVKRAGVRTLLVLGEDARPAALQACHPKGYSKFSLMTRRGGLVRIYDTALMSNSQYKSLLISDRTTADELLTLLLTCYNSTEKVEQFSLYEVCEAQEYQRKLHPDDLPLMVQQAWQAGVQICHFLVRRNPDYKPLQRRKQMLWSQEFQPSSKQLPFFQTMQQTAESFSSLSLTSPLVDKKSHSEDVLNNTDSKIYPPRNKSIDNILEDNGDKWGNYVNFKCESLKPMVTEKSLSCDSEKNAFCVCKTCGNNNVKIFGNSSMISSKSCHQIGYYSPVYKFPSIASYCGSNRFSSKSFDTNSLSSIDSDELVTSTPNPSPVVTSFEAAAQELSESRKSLPSALPATSKLPPLAAPRKKISHSHADYENYFYI